MLVKRLEEETEVERIPPKPKNRKMKPQGLTPRATVPVSIPNPDPGVMSRPMLIALRPPPLRGNQVDVGGLEGRNIEMRFPRGILTKRGEAVSILERESTGRLVDLLID